MGGGAPAPRCLFHVVSARVCVCVCPLQSHIQPLWDLSDVFFDLQPKRLKFKVFFLKDIRSACFNYLSVTAFVQGFVVVLNRCLIHFHLIYNILKLIVFLWSFTNFLTAWGVSFKQHLVKRLLHSFKH